MKRILKAFSLVLVLGFMIFLTACEFNTEQPDKESPVITSVYYNGTDHLIILLSNGEEQDLGSIDVITNIKIVDGELIIEFAIGESQNMGSLIGLSGQDGKAVLLQTSETHIQWKYDGDTQWNNLISLELLKGEKGDPGKDGREVEFAIEEGFIVWRYAGVEEWINLVNLELLKGATGLAGADGREAIFNVSETHIQWKYEDEEEFTPLISLESLKGEDGINGLDGKDGINVVSASINEVGHLMLTLSNGNMLDAGLVVGLDGKDGQDGEQGPKGEQGNPGEDGKSAYEIYLENYPEYESSEEEWLDDLINGRLGTKAIYTITFDSKGGTEIQNQEIDKNETILKPEDPTKEGYTFDGWYVDGDTKWLFSVYGVLKDLTLKAHWIPNTYQITFEPGFGILDELELGVIYGTHVILPTPILEDTYFMGWYEGNSLIEDGVWTLASDITLRAYYIQEKYNVYYDFNYGDITDSDIANYGQPYSPIEAIREGYVFNGWYDEDNVLYQGETVWEKEYDLYLTAEWEAKIYRVFLDPNDGEFEGNHYIDVEYGKYYNLPVPTSINEPFNGWYRGEIKYTDKLGNSLNPFKDIEDIELVAVYYIEIYSKEDLINVSNDLEATYYLMNDIDIFGDEWIPIGDEDNPFRGIFVGNEFTVSGLTITTSHNYVGLFGYNEGTLKNINLDIVEINITGSIDQTIYSGSLVGYNKGVIENVETISGDIYLKARGALGEGYLGGIIGYNNYGNISNLNNSINVEGDTNTFTGGFIGYSYFGSTTIKNSYNVGEVTGKENVGGFIGHSYYESTSIENSYNTGKVTGNVNVGGFIGYSFYGMTIENSYNVGEIIGENNTSGFIGYINSGTIIIKNSYNIGEITGKNNIGSFIGNNDSYTTTIENSYNAGNVIGKDNVGGFMGNTLTVNITIENSYNEGSVTGKFDYFTISYAGGFLGRMNYGTIRFKNSYNTGKILGFNYVGGFIGETYSSIVTIENSYNSGSVTANNYLGGIIGEIKSEVRMYIYHVINLGDVISTKSTIDIGSITGPGEVTDLEEVYYTSKVYINNDEETTGIDVGTKITDLLLIDVEFFTGTLLFDPEVWDLDDIDVINGIYPILK